MKLSDKIEVEALDDERIANLERRIVARLGDGPARRLGDGAPRWWAAAMALAVVVVLAGAVGWFAHARRMAGDTAGVGEHAAERMVVIGDGDGTGDHARQRVALGDATIFGDARASYAVSRGGGGVLIEMRRGRIELEVAKRSGRPPLVVRAGDTEVVVVGTRFSVDYGDGGADGADGEVAVEVSEGAVRVRRQRQETPVSAGQRWTSRGGRVASAAAGDPARGDIAGRGGAAPCNRGRASATSGSGAADGSGVAVASDDGCGVANADGSAQAGAGTVATATNATGPGAAAGSATPAAGGYGAVTAEVGPVPGLRGRVASVPTAGQAATAAGRAAAAQRTATTLEVVRDGERRAASPRDQRGGVDLMRAVRSQPVLAAMDVGTADATTAMAKYRAIMVGEKGAREAYAFYSMAATQALKLGRTQDALATLEAFKRRAARSEYSLPALWLELRVRCTRAIDEGCRQAAAVYQRHAPEGAARAVAEAITLTN